ncbi:MAG: riboflavin biosynthesis protein RibF [Gammaproteobacteria bacterium RIFCSPHIGHO2_12_FULL_42_13]|nr:MAG: riboflavin biosynthesis protein RibF [Gammaproteobacteria bacterium RIFCSPHIGHO2_12_FULL_42_13]
MKLIRDKNIRLPGSVVTIGNFDGVHIGHQRLMVLLQSAASTLALPSVALTFHPHPSEFFAAHATSARIMRFSEKWRVLESFDLDYCYVMRFSEALARLSPEEFVNTILVKQLNTKKIIVGDEFKFGAKRAGDITLLKDLGQQYGFVVEALSQSCHEGRRICSTDIREAIQQGDFQLSKTLMGRSFTLSGKVAYGNQIGRTLGFPTANIYLRRKQVPLMGIFVVRVFGLSQAPLPGVASVGYRPTFNGKEILLEVHLFDFDQVIYGKRLTVEFLHKIRDEIKFTSVDALIEKMHEDAKIARTWDKELCKINFYN